MAIQLDKVEFTGNPKEDIAAFSRYWGQWKLPCDRWQNYYKGGGNSSVHNGEKLYVKLSGGFLSTATADGFGEVDVNQINEGLGDSALQQLCMQVLNSDYTRDFKCVDDLDNRVSALFRDSCCDKGNPSVETGLHAQLHGTQERWRWNMHDHNSLVNALLCSENAGYLVNRLFGKNKHIKYMPFIEPGAPLSIMFNIQMHEWIKQDEEPSVILMAQHGKIQTGYSPPQLCKLADYVLKKVEERLPTSWLEFAFGMSNVPSIDTSGVPYIQRCLEKMFRCYVKPFAKDKVLMRMLHSEKAIKRIENGMPNPDAVVYAGAAPMIVYWDSSNHSRFEGKLKATKQAYIKKWTEDCPLNANKSEYLPKVLLVPKLGAFALGKNEEEADRIYAALLDTAYVMAAAEVFGGMKPLSYKHLFYITNWRAEHRRKLVAERMK